MFKVNILKDSVNPVGDRLTTFELTYPRFIHSELMTHRLFSRNAASSRAIPISKVIDAVKKNPATPIWWGKNQAGMQAQEELEENDLYRARELWLDARDMVIEVAEKMSHIGLHKQITNRILEPWVWITTIVSATEYDNWFHLRKHKDAQPEIQRLAQMMWLKYENNDPDYLFEGEWHIPLIDEEDWEKIHDKYTHKNGKECVDLILSDAKKISVGRCARVSYLTHDGVRDIEKDIELHDRLCSGPLTGEPGHWSPFEHVAQALGTSVYSGNFIGFKQYRKFFDKEHYPYKRE